MTDELQWTNVWKRNDWGSAPIQYGVDDAIAPDGRRYYMAWSQCGGDCNQRFEDGPYEVYNQADVVMPGGYRAMMQQTRDALIGQAAVARSRMTEKQKSGQDMKMIADLLRVKAVNHYADWQKAEEERREAKLEDKRARNVARQMLYGLQLIRESGTAEEKDLLAKAFPSESDTTKKKKG